MSERVTVAAVDKEALSEAFRDMARPPRGWPENNCPRIGCDQFWAGAPHEHPDRCAPDARGVIEVPRDGAEFHTHTPPGETPRHAGVIQGRGRPMSKPGPY